MIRKTIKLWATMESLEFAKKKLMTPGPVPLSHQVKKVFAEYECHHRTSDFTEILSQVFLNLKKVFQTQEHCFILPSTGTGALEASLVNTLSSKDKILTINAGKFGARWGQLAKAFSVEVKELKLPWGQDIDLHLIEKELQTGQYKALAFQGCETSTGALLPVQELCNLCQQNDVLSLVDGITALGAVDIPMDKWGVDVFVGGSQKAFMLPTGMSFVSFSQKAQGLQSDLPSFYFDLNSERKANQQGKTRWSTQTHMVLALSFVLDEIVHQTGLKKHFAEINERAQFFRQQLSCEWFPQTPAPSLTCLKVPQGKSSNKIKSQVAGEGFIIMGGQDQLNDKVLRVGHMGEMSFDDLKNTAQAIKKFL